MEKIQSVDACFGVGTINKFYLIFENEELYPDNVAENGVPQDTLYSNISNTFLNGLINYVDNWSSFLLQRYSSGINNLNHILEKFEKSFHKDFSIFPDDVVVLAETKNSYWFFYSDKDCSDCEIGRVNKNKFVNFNGFQSFFLDNFRFEHDELKYIKLPELTGWIKF